MITFGSLFAGIGGFDKGFTDAGMRGLWNVEIDPFCRRVLRKHFPEAKQFEDVRTVGAHNLEYVDVICGGFPCQDISGANPNGKGLEGARSGLWHEYARIIREVKPRRVVVENVARLLSINAGRDFGTVLADLASCGYDAEWDVLSAAAFGAPHLRERVFIIAYNHNVRCHSGGHQGQGIHGNQTRTEIDSSGQDATDTPSEQGRRIFEQRFFTDSRTGSATRNISHPPGVHAQGFYNGQRQGQLGGSDWWAVEPAVGRVADGVPARVDRLKGLGNAVVPQIAEWIGRHIMEIEAA